MAIESTHDTKDVKLKWNVETKLVYVLCDDDGAASRHLSKLIERKLVGTVEGVILRSSDEATIVRIIRGKNIIEFLQLGHETRSYKPKTKFSDILSKKNKKDD